MNTLPYLQESLLHLAVKTALLLSIALAAGALLRRFSAARRYTFWLGAVIAAVLLPLAVFVAPAWRVMPLPADAPGWPVLTFASLGFGAGQDLPPHDSSAGPASPAQRPSPSAASSSAAPIAVPTAPVPPASLPARISEPAPASWPLCLPLVWLAVTAILLARLLFGAWRLRDLERSCQVLPPEAWQDHACSPSTVAAELGLRQPPLVLVGPSGSVPMVWGVFRTRLLLPDGFNKWSPDQLRAVLLHELSHLQRRDPMALWTARIMQALHWFNPLAWLTLHRLCADQERACDDTVLRHGIRPSDYSQHLLDLSRGTRLAPGLSLCALAMARTAPVESRVAAILDTRRRREAATLRWTSAQLLLALTAAVPLAMLHAAEAGPRLRGRLLDRNGVVLAESTPETLRRYPLQAFASHVIGYTGRSGPQDLTPQGRDGMEHALDASLRTGEDARLSLDARLQSHVEQDLARGGHNGAVVVLDIATGEVLTMASWPVYDPNAWVPNIDPNRFKDLLDDPRLPMLPRAFRGEYPPGGLFRITTAMAALADGKKDVILPCDGVTNIGGRQFRDWQTQPHGPLGLEDALVQGCNAYTYQMAGQLGAEKLSAIMAALGFARHTGLPLRSEGRGSIPSRPDRAITGGELASLSIGQGAVSATPVQLAQAASLLASDGQAPPPSLLKGKANPASPRTFGLTAADWQFLRQAMRRSVTEGPSKAAASTQCEIAALSGTAQWKLSRQQSLASMIGFAPYEKPRIAFAIVLEGRPGEAVSGGSLCGPVARSLVERFVSLPNDGSGPVSPTQEDAGPAPKGTNPYPVRFHAPLPPKPVHPPAPAVEPRRTAFAPAIGYPAIPAGTLNETDARRWLLLRTAGELAQLPAEHRDLKTQTTGSGFPRGLKLTFLAPREVARTWMLCCRGYWTYLDISQHTEELMSSVTSEASFSPKTVPVFTSILPASPQQTLTSVQSGMKPWPETGHAGIYPCIGRAMESCTVTMHARDKDTVLVTITGHRSSPPLLAD